jgi:hypothetical protein
MSKNLEKIKQKSKSKKQKDYYHFDKIVNYSKQIKDYTDFETYYSNFKKFVETDWKKKKLPFLRYTEIQDKYEYKTNEEYKNGDRFEIELKNKKTGEVKKVKARRKKIKPKLRILT